MIWQRECFDLIDPERSLQGNFRDWLETSNLEGKAESQPDFPCPYPTVPMSLWKFGAFQEGTDKSF